MPCNALSQDLYPLAIIGILQVVPKLDKIIERWSGLYDPILRELVGHLSFRLRLPSSPVYIHRDAATSDRGKSYTASYVEAPLK